MKRTRGICLLFILISIAIVLCFWFGFVFGKESQRQADLVAITEARLEAENSTEKNANNTAKDANHLSESNENNTGIEDGVSVTTNYEFSQPQFYLKAENEYVSVYVSATDELYFETDVIVEELPIELQEDVKKGLEFYNLESVYTFLENYSS